MTIRKIADLKISQGSKDIQNGKEEFSVTGNYLSDFERNLLKEDLKKETRKACRQRIEIILLTDEGWSQTQICKALQCAPDTARYWSTMTKMGLAHLWNKTLVGRPKKITAFYLNRLQELIAHSPNDYGYFCNRWTGRLLSEHLAGEFQINVSPRHLNRLLKNMNFSPQKNSYVNTGLTVRTPGGIIFRDLTPM